MQTQHPPFSLVYQITQECPYECPICLRRYMQGERPMKSEDRRKMIDLLKAHGLKRLTITGGEPTILGDGLFSFLEYIHSKGIHTCLSSTGHRLGEENIQNMDRYLDQFLISVRSLNLKAWIEDFGDTKYTADLFDNVVGILQWIQTTGIILEVNTVIHKENLQAVVDLGWQLVKINPNIVWRLDEYYPTGIEAHNRSRFEISKRDFEDIRSVIENTFGNSIRRIRFGDKESRVQSPEYFVTHTGELVTTSNFVHMPTGYNLITGPLPSQFENLRPWSVHRLVCRDWGWGDL